MAVTQSDLDRIDAALANSELSVSIDGRTVTYRSVPEMLQARRHLAALVAASSPSGGRRVYQYRFTTVRGD
jgi:hypothetical protein